MSELDNQKTQEILGDASQGARGGANTLRSLNNAFKNTAKRTAKTSLKMFKKASKEIGKRVAKDGAKAGGKLASKLAFIFPWKAVLIIVLIMLGVIIFTSVYSKQPDAVTEYENYKSYEGKKNPQPKEPDEAVEPQKGNYPVDENIENFMGDNESVSGYEEGSEEITYQGEDETTRDIGDICLDYIAYYNELFDYVYNVLCYNEILKLIQEMDYNADATISSYNAQKSPFKDNLNFAELLCVMSQNEALSLGNATVNSIHEYLTADEFNQRLKNLFTIVANEKIGSTVLYSNTVTKKEKTTDTKLSRNQTGEKLSEISFENIKIPQSTISLVLSGKMDYSEFIEYAETHKDEVYEEVAKGYEANGRTIVVHTDEKPVFRITEVVSNQRLEKGDEYLHVTPEEFYRDYEPTRNYILEDDGRVRDIDTGIYEYTESVENTIITDITREIVWEYTYAEVSILPYSLHELYQCFEIDVDEFNVSHPSATNLETLTEQENGLREIASDIDFGSKERTPYETDYSMLIKGLSSEEATDLTSSLRTQLRLSGEWQTDIIESCKSLTNVTYGSSYNGIGANYWSFVCCSYVYEAYKKIGMDICPAKLPEEADNMVWGKGKALYYTCTLMAYYFRHYQPQAVYYTSSMNDWEVGDIVFMQYKIDPKNTPYNPQYISKTGKTEYSDHVYIYIGNDNIAEQSQKKSKIRKLTSDYANATWFIVRPSMLH